MITFDASKCVACNNRIRVCPKNHFVSYFFFERKKKTERGYSLRIINRRVSYDYV